MKGEPDVNLTVAESVHGPIISGVSGDAASLGPRVALKWTALAPGDTTLDAFLGLNYARNWTDFTDALKFYVAPSQNFVYADLDGNTGYYAPGNIPVRHSEVELSWDGSLPTQGDGQHEWTGFIPFGDLPHTYNPADGLIVTANNKVVPDSYPYFLANNRNWAEPYRAERITELLTAKDKLSVDDVKAPNSTPSVWCGVTSSRTCSRPSRTATSVPRRSICSRTGTATSGPTSRRR